MAEADRSTLPSRRSAPRRWSVPFLLLLGLFGPLFAVTWYAFELQRDALENVFEGELDTMAQVLANGMRDPVWNLIPESGSPMLDALAEDDRVLSVTVISLAQGQFLQFAVEPELGTHPVTLERDITHEGETIGRVVLTVDRSTMDADLAAQWQKILLAAAAQFAISLAIVLLATRLHGAHLREASLLRLNAELNREIEERRDAERAMLQAKEEAQMANRSKTEFLAHVSHELRTPLNAIIGFSETLDMQLLGPVENPKHREYLRHILESGQHLLSLIGDILDISRIEANEADYQDEECNLVAITQTCITMVKGRAESKGVRLSMSVPAELPHLSADPRCLKQILINLLSNAVKFTNSGGAVALSAVMQDNGDLIISIADTGIGMSAEDIPRAMEPFTRLADSATSSTEGTGLGLSLVAILVKAHDGKLLVTSAPDKGTTVQVIFPASRICRPPRIAAAS